MRLDLFIFNLYYFFGNNEPGAVGTTRVGGPPANYFINISSKNLRGCKELCKEELQINLTNVWLTAENRAAVKIYTLVQHVAMFKKLQMGVYFFLKRRRR